MGISELLLLLIANGVVTGLVFFSEFKRVKSSRYPAQEGAETD